MARRILTSGWRYKVAQTVLRWLYGRPYHYISPWRAAGVSAACILHHNGKALVGLRDGHIEGSGKWGIVGGYLNGQDSEPLAEGLVREIYEETGLQLSPKHFPHEAIKYTYLWYDREYIEQENYTSICCFYWHEITEAEVAQLTPKDETADLKFIDETDFKKMVSKGEIAFIDAQLALQQFFNRPL